MTEQEEQIWEQIQLEQRRKTQDKAVRIIAYCLLVFIVGLFIFSPCLQLILRLMTRNNPKWELAQYDIPFYQHMIQAVHQIVLLAALLCYGLLISRIVRNRKAIRTKMQGRWKYLVPVVLLWLFAVTIPFVTAVRGPSDYDLGGHHYMGESIFYYMLYPTCYFFCGVMLWQSKIKRALLYLLLFSAIPINVLTLVDEWGEKIPFFLGTGVAGVFHNSNHYGYYLAIVIVASFVLFVYEQKAVWKVFNVLSAVLGTVVLILNNTLGAYLAVLLVMIAFAVYCLLCDRRHFGWSLAALGGFVLVTIVMGFWYSTVISSIVQLFSDAAAIAANPFETEMSVTSGTDRWMRWRGVVTHMPESPLLGFGVEGLLDLYQIGTPHNELLQYAASFGIPAMLMYLTAVIWVIVSVLRRSKKLSKMTLVCFCVMVCYFTSSMFGVAIYYTTPFFYIFLGLTYAEILHGTQDQKTDEQIETA